MNNNLYLKKEWFFYLGIFIAFNMMLTNYLYEFDSGAVKGGGTLRFFLKFLSVFLIILSQPFPSKLLIKKNSLLILCFALFLISTLLYVPFSTWNEPQFYNMFFVFFILFGVGYNQKFIPKLNHFLICIFLFIWLPVDLYFLLSGNSLWENKAFIGGFGNPTSYGMILFYLILINKGIFRPIWERTINFFLLFSLFLTQALMPILIMVMLSFFIFRKRIIILTGSSLLLIGLVYMDLFLDYFGLVDLHFLIKLNTLFYDGLTSDIGSIFYRLEYWKDIYKLFENPFVFLFGHVDGVSYNAGDGQYIAYLTSFGFPLFLFFIFSVFKIVYEFKYFDFTNSLRFKSFFIAFLVIR